MKMLQVTTFCVLCIFFNNIFAADLPYYIKPCSIKDPEKFNKCFVKHGNEAIPSFINGDKKFKVPSLNPLQITEVDFNPSPQLMIRVKNVEVYGLPNAKVKNGSYQPDPGEMIFEIFVPNVTIVGNYVSKGRILILPLEGNGRMKMEISNVVYNYSIAFENMNFESNKTLKLKGTKITFHPDNLVFQFDNLLNGNKLLSDEINKVLTENWRAVHDELSPVFAATLDEIIKSIVANTLEKYRFKDAFLP